MTKNVAVLAISLLLAILIVVFVPGQFNSQANKTFETEAQEKSIIDQNITSIAASPKTIQKLYKNNELVGIVSSENALKKYLNTIYEDDYKTLFPDSKITLGKNIYLVEEQSYYIYENKDDDIFNYLTENDLFSIKATLVSFSDENGIYAEMYVKNKEIYNEALMEYLSYYVDKDELNLLLNGRETAILNTYDTRSVGISISQTISLSEGYANPSDVLATKEEILNFIEYGDNNEKEYYVVQKYDTVAGVGAKNKGLSATQVMNINRDKITSVDQILTEGEELCVTYFEPIFDVVVEKESMRKEEVYPTTVYVEDETVRVGQTELVEQGVNGSRNALYSEKWINGVLVNGTLKSSVVTLQPINEVVAVGSMEVPSIGTGTYRWPIENPTISCGWGCYTYPHFHEAIDIQNLYDLYGKIYAADRGVIVKNGYDGISGNYIVIDHNNGQRTYYGHMSIRSPLMEGTVVDKGDYIGQIGMTGRATGPHVHFYIEKNGEIQNPCDGYLDCTVMR